MMHHISYSSQYMDDLRMFAFISRDKKTPKYYCNVFQSPTIVSVEMLYPDATFLDSS